jgi:hypothetical protein
VAFGAASVAAADFDGDDVLDIAITSHGARAVLVLAGHGDGTFAPAVGFGTRRGPLALTVADLDANKMPDLATVDWDAGTVSLLQNLSLPTAVAITDLAARCAGGVPTLTWRLSTTSLSELEEIVVQRARSAAGPYLPCTLAPLLPQEAMLFVDRDPLPGRRTWYRLQLLMPHGGIVIGPVDVEDCAPGDVQVTASQGRNGTVEIRYTLGAAAAVRLAVYGANGHLVRQLVAARLDAGAYTHPWDARDSNGTRVASGVYFIRLEADKVRLATKWLHLNTD